LESLPTEEYFTELGENSIKVDERNLISRTISHQKERDSGKSETKERGEDPSKPNCRKEGKQGMYIYICTYVCM
jgi:hypothetical protein